MFNLPELLVNPANDKYKLTVVEEYSIKEAYELIELEKYSYSLFAIWNCVIINIQRRIEEFGIETFLMKFEKEANFNKSGENLKERWLNVNEYQTINYAKELSIISHVTHDLITMIYWMKFSSNEEQKHIIDKNEIYSILYLLERNLFLEEFKKDKRQKTSNTQLNQNRRTSDLNIIHNNEISTENIIEQKVNTFKKESKNTYEEEKHLLDKYC